MTIHLTPEQERRLRAVLDRGAYKSVEEAVRRTIQSLGQNPHVGPRYSSSNPRVHNLRSWPVAGFEAIRIYYSLEADAMHIIRILHGKRDVRRILGNE